MKFEGHLTIEREHIMEAMRGRLAARLEHDGFAVIAAEPLRARHRLAWFKRMAGAIRAGGNGKLIRQARELRFALPLSGAGRVSYFLDIPGLGRLGVLVVVLAALLGWSREGAAIAIYAAVFSFGGLAIGLHYLMRKSVRDYLGLAPGHFAEHRLTMG